MERLRLASTATAVAASMLLLVGCGAQGVTLPPGADQLAVCEVTVIGVEELDAAGAPGCDLAGSSLTFPDGLGTLTVPAVGSVFSQFSGETRDLESEILIVNWGVPGVGAATIADGHLVEVWASSPEALDLQRQQLRVEGVATD